MKRLFLASCCAAALYAAAPVAAQDWSGYDDRWYVGVSGGVVRLDPDRYTDEFGPYVGVYFGRFFSPNFSLDLNIDGYRGEFDGADLARVGLNPAFDGTDFDLLGYGLHARWHFGAESDRHRPFALLGVGIQEHDNFLDDGRDIYANAGFGVQSRLGDNWRFRSQLELRYDNDRDTRRFRGTDTGFFDVIASVGLSWSFGEPPRPPAPAVEPPRPAVQPPPPARPAPQPKPQPKPVEPEVLFEFETMVFFDFDSAKLRPEAEAQLDEAVDVLKGRDDVILIEVAGHTDDIGDAAYNQNLSERRAQSVADYLVSKGIERSRLKVVGYGETRPAVPNTSRENRQKNRRVVLSVLERR